MIPNEKHGGNADQPIARRADREAAANANQEEDGGQEDREAHVLVRRSAADWPSLKYASARVLQRQPLGLLWDSVLRHV